MDAPFAFMLPDSDGSYKVDQLKTENTSSPTLLYWLPQSLSIVLAIGLTLTFAFGLLGKLAIFSAIRQVRLRVRPVNLLILTDQTINLVHRSMTIWGSAFVLLAKRPLVVYFGQGFCSVFTSIPLFGTSHSVYGSFGITCYRAICLRYAMRGVRVKQCWPLAIVLLFISLSASLLTSVVFAMTSTKSYVSDLCYAENEDYFGVLRAYNRNSLLKLKELLAHC